MSKLIFSVVFIGLLVIAIVIKVNYQKAVMENALTTTGKITRSIQRGKLPYCEFTYSVNNIEYRKKQEVPKHLKDKILNKTFTVYYNADNPKQAIIKFK